DLATDVVLPINLGRHRAVQAPQPPVECGDGHAAQTDLRVGDHNTCLDNVALLHFTLQPRRHGLDVEATLCDLGRDDLHVGDFGQDRKGNLCDLFVLDSLVAVREEGTHVTIEGPNHPLALLFGAEPRVDVLDE